MVAAYGHLRRIVLSLSEISVHLVHVPLDRVGNHRPQREVASPNRVPHLPTRVARDDQHPVPLGQEVVRVPGIRVGHDEHIRGDRVWVLALEARDDVDAVVGRGQHGHSDREETSLVSGGEVGLGRPSDGRDRAAALVPGDEGVSVFDGAEADGAVPVAVAYLQVGDRGSQGRRWQYAALFEEGVPLPKLAAVVLGDLGVRNILAHVTADRVGVDRRFAFDAGEDVDVLVGDDAEAGHIRVLLHVFGPRNDRLGDDRGCGVFLVVLGRVTAASRLGRGPLGCFRVQLGVRVGRGGPSCLRVLLGELRCVLKPYGIGCVTAEGVIPTVGVGEPRCALVVVEGAHVMVAPRLVSWNLL